MRALYSCVDGAAVLYSFVSLILLPPLGKIFSQYDGNSHCYADDAFLYLTMELIAIGVSKHHPTSSPYIQINEMSN